MNMPELSTERLLLQPLQLADAAAIQQLFPHWRVVRFLNAQVPWPYPEDGALNYLRDVALPAIERGVEWHWSIRLRTTPEQMIGCISLMEETDNNRGFWLAPQWQGQGLIGEASACVTTYWFETLGRDLMRVPKAALNLASRRVSEREGMRWVRSEERHFVSGRLPCDIWEISREEWRRLR
ncbi:GNAT family N-acetyltransferase [Pseudomonas sp. FEN]|uniref:GNAT family N-acetyltransferase n=1 Tax=Pseudomonas sp. FEN TaxID=2767468 RepID=UPI00174D1361|nr:GNAT family N-acetyltransferase [Pseudomonas sp. FEN]